MRQRLPPFAQLRHLQGAVSRSGPLRGVALARLRGSSDRMLILWAVAGSLILLDLSALHFIPSQREERDPAHAPYKDSPSSLWLQARGLQARCDENSPHEAPSCQEMAGSVYALASSPLNRSDKRLAIGVGDSPCCAIALKRPISFRGIPVPL
jgi:hypothetical protein